MSRSIDKVRDYIRSKHKEPVTINGDDDIFENRLIDCNCSRP